MNRKNWLLAGLCLVGLLAILRIIRGINDDDFRVGIVNDQGMIMESVSSLRRMRNIFKIKGENKVWVPGGMGWYRSDKIGQLIIGQEKKPELLAQVFFYNFGFSPDLVIYGDEEWTNRREVISAWGIGNYLNFILNLGKLMTKQEEVKGNVRDPEADWGEIIQRDLADSRLLKEETRLTVYNLSQANGLGGFMAQILEWSGLTVVGVDSPDQKIEGMCLIKFGPTVEKSETVKVLKEKFSQCKVEKSEGLPQQEIELYFGDEFAKMINYESYVRTF